MTIKDVHDIILIHLLQVGEFAKDFKGIQDRYRWK
jgi:hypothetical protein